MNCVSQISRHCMHRLTARSNRFFSLVQKSKANQTIYSKSANATRALSTSFLFDNNSLDKEAALSTKLCQKALQKVPLYGWTDDAIVAAADELGLDESEPLSLSVSGLVDPNKLIHFYMQQCNEELRKELDQRKNTVWLVQSTTLVNCVVEAIQLRLSMQKVLISNQRWHEGMALGAQPSNILTTRAQLHDLIDIIANAVSGQMNGTAQISPLEHFGLGSVYVTTELHMLADSSLDFADTWDFLRARVENWEQLRHSSGPLNSLSLSPQFLAVTTLGPSLLGGALSVLSPSAALNLSQWTQQIKTPPEYLWSALVYAQQQQQQQQQKSTSPLDLDGTQPSHYQKQTD